jgi:hypothetical protein
MPASLSPVRWSGEDSGYRDGPALTVAGSLIGFLL